MQEKTLVAIEVPDEFDNQRLDIFITRMIDVIPSRSFATKLIDSKKVKIDKKFTKASYKVKKSQIIEVDLSFQNELSEEPIGEEIPLNILYEDADLLVINKSAGMVVHPGAGVHSGTLVNAVLAYTGMTLPSLGGPIRAGIVHRLDRDTSGVMVVAKSQLALTHLSKQFAEHSQIRIYHAIVYGKLPSSEGEIVTWHGRDLKNRLKYSVQAEGVGKKAILKYKLLKEFGNLDFSLVSCSLYTGRTHQIRVQMAYLGNGIVGDSLYSKIPDKLKNKKELFAQVTKNSPRQMLHALHLEFVHPRHGKQMKFIAPYPADFQNLYNLLQIKCN